MPGTAQETRFATRLEYRQAIDAVLGAAAREVRIFDPDLRGTGIESRARADMLAAFLSGARDRSLRIVVHDVDYVSGHCPRVAELFRRFSHCCHLRQTPDGLRDLADCFMVADNAHAVVRFHTDHFRGKLLLGLPDEVQGWCRRFDDLWLQSLPAAPLTPLGL